MGFIAPLFPHTNKETLLQQYYSKSENEKARKEQEELNNSGGCHDDETKRNKHNYPWRHNIYSDRLVHTVSMTKILIQELHGKL